MIRRVGDDVTIVSAGVGIHRALQAAESVKAEGISAAVLDLRTISPLDKTTFCETVAHTRRLLVVDEDYEGFGLSGELGAVALEAGISFKYARVCTQTTIPYARDREDQTLPNVKRIRAAIAQLVRDKR
jgi:pyruvate dehydrogenase E1 component beta subunit